MEMELCIRQASHYALQTVPALADAKGAFSFCAFVCVLINVLTSIVCSDCTSRLMIRSGQIVINPPDEGFTTGYLLTPQTGLLKSCSSSEGQTVNTQTTAKVKTRSEQAEDDGTISRSACLIIISEWPARS